MKIPQSPPDLDAIWSELEQSPERLRHLFQTVSGPLVDGEYCHWDKLRHLPAPAGLQHRAWWLALKLQRSSMYKPIPLRALPGGTFHFSEVDPIPERLHQIDMGAGGTIRMVDPVTNPDVRDQYCVRSLVEEAITSSQLEGAATTTPIAKEMIRSGRKPRDRSERMILNNYRTMRRIGKLKDQSLSPTMVYEIHRIVTEGTLDDPSAAGRLRRNDEHVVVDDQYGEVLHDPPPATELADRLLKMCTFANSTEPFIHPVLRSILLHFWLAYDHPFVDGNGRTARAIFYWSMLHHGFWLCEFISISRAILESPAQYGRSFLHTETDDGDLTYFILYHLEIIRKAINQLHEFIADRTRELQQLETQLQGMLVLNHRQRSLIRHALRHPHERYTIASHRESHNVVYETARQDMLDLKRRGLFRANQIGKTWHYRPAPDIETRLAEPID